MIEKSGLEAWRRFLRAHAAVVSAIERDLDRAGHIPLIWYDVLVAISAAPEGRLRLNELGRELVLTRSGATRLADKLEVALLVERQRAPDDRRGVYVLLTERGRSALRRAWPVYAKGIRDGFLAKLSADEVGLLSTVLGRIAVPTDSPADLPIDTPGLTDSPADPQIS